MAHSACQCRRCRRLGFDTWMGKIPWRRKWQSTPELLPGKSHGQRSLIGYTPWSRKESDMTERLHSLKSPRRHAQQRKKLLKGYTYAPQLERCPHSPQAEKTLHSNEDPAEPRRNSRKIKKTPGQTFSWVVMGFVFQGNVSSFGIKSMYTVKVYT